MTHSVNYGWQNALPGVATGVLQAGAGSADTQWMQTKFYEFIERRKQVRTKVRFLFGLFFTILALRVLEELGWKPAETWSIISMVAFIGTAVLTRKSLESIPCPSCSFPLSSVTISFSAKCKKCGIHFDSVSALTNTEVPVVPLKPINGFEAKLRSIRGLRGKLLLDSYAGVSNLSEFYSNLHLRRRIIRSLGLVALAPIHFIFGVRLSELDLNQLLSADHLPAKLVVCALFATAFYFDCSLSDCPFCDKSLGRSRSRARSCQECTWDYARAREAETNAFRTPPKFKQG